MLNTAKGTQQMKTAIIGICMSFISVDTIARVIAFCIAKLIKYASRRGGNAWEKTKSIMKNVENWVRLFNEVYEDDELSEEEEKKIADAIANLTSVKRISKIIESKK